MLALIPVLAARFCPTFGSLGPLPLPPPDLLERVRGDGVGENGGHRQERGLGLESSGISDEFQEEHLSVRKRVAYHTGPHEVLIARLLPHDAVFRLEVEAEYSVLRVYAVVLNDAKVGGDYVLCVGPGHAHNSQQKGCNDQFHVDVEGFVVVGNVPVDYLVLDAEEDISKIRIQ